MSSTATPLQPVADAFTADAGIRLYIKREDQGHPLAPGNKWRKLKYNLDEARRLGHRTLLTFGGAHSNHIHAAAGLAPRMGLRAVGVIRGGAWDGLTPTLEYAVGQGMQLYFVDRERYRDKYAPGFLADLEAVFGPFYLIPEGGSNPLALRGVGEMVSEIDGQLAHYDTVVVPVGSGGTLAGIAGHLAPRRRALGVAVLKDGAFLEAEVRTLLDKSGLNARGEWRLLLDCHCGGYAKVDGPLVRFMADFEARHGITLDPVYTGKMMAAIYQLMAQGQFRRGETVVAVHTGGLQGREAMAPRMQRALDEAEAGP